MKSILALIAITAFSSAAMAEKVTTKYLFNCNMSFTAKGTSAYLGVGYTETDGKGNLSCFDYATGVTEIIPLKVTVRGLGLGLGITGFSITGSALNLGINKEPESLLGTYLKVSANAAIGVGGEAASTLRFSLNKGSANIGVEVSGRSGLGGGIDISKLKIARSGPSKMVKAQAAATTAVPATVKSVPAPSQAKVYYIKPNQTLVFRDANGRELYRVRTAQ